MRRPIVAANWKMHKTSAEAAELVSGLRDRLDGFDSGEVVLCPPFTALHVVARALQGSSMRLGAQNLHWEAQGAFTGEVSAGMLLDAGCAYVIVGHSERRTCFHETDRMVARKVTAALAAGLRPIVCVGEELEARQQGRTEAVLREQFEGGLAGLGPDLQGVVLAYEPVWAIGTGHTATAEQAQAAHVFLRGLVADAAGSDVADAIRIQYGGSVNAGNAAELFGMPDVDGGLVGGASLAADSFATIVRAA